MDNQLKERISEIVKGNSYYPINYLFFRRYPKITDKNVYFYDLTEKTRFKLIQTISEYINDSEIKKLIKRMEIEFGREIPSKNTDFEKIKNFLLNCSAEEFLTTLEILINLKYEGYLFAVIFDRSHVRKSTGERVIVTNNELLNREKHLNSFIKIINKIFKIDNIKYKIIPVGLNGLPFLITPHLDIKSITNSLLNMNSENFEDSLNKFKDALDEYNMNKFEESIANLKDSLMITLKSILKIENIEFKNENIHELFSKIQHKVNIINNPISFDFVISLLMNKTNNLRSLFEVSKKEISNNSIKDYNKFVIGITGLHIMILINRYDKGNIGESMVDPEAIFIGKIAKLIEKRETEPIDWVFLLETFEFDYLLADYPRLIRSQDFRDEDYPRNFRNVIKDAYKKNKDNAKLMIKYILEECLKLEEEDFFKYPWLKDFLENDDFEMFIPSKTKYLDIETLPDDFYRDLRDLINKSYSLGLYVAVQIFSRKMLENLIVDILRRKYGMSNSNLFYIQKQGRFHGFKTLLENFQKKLNDFKIIVPSLDKTFIKKIDAFRLSGNSSAHTLELTVTKKELDDKKDDLNSIVKTLIRILDNI